MKPVYTLIVLSTLALALISCSEDDRDPGKPLRIHPIRMEMEDYHRELMFDQNDRLAGIKMISFFRGDEPLESTINFYYSAGHRIDSSATSDGHLFKYTYESGLLTRSDGFINGSLAQYHTFTYDDRKRVIENISWQHMVEEDGWVPHQKGTYTYDINDNLVETVLYYYNTGTDQHELLTRFTYSDYDDKQSADRFFNTTSFNPTIKFNKNNPGKMVVQNRYGNTTSIEVYSHQYNSSGYPEKRTTTVTIPYNGQNGSYETNFFYEFR